MVNNNTGRSQSLWMEITLPEFPKLENDIETDVCIIGGGIVGLSCAYTLSKQGVSVVVVDQGQIAGGQTARTTGHLTWVLDDRYANLESFFGTNGAKMAAHSHAAAIDYVEKNVKEEGIDCDFERVDSYLFVPPEDSKEVLDKEFDVLTRIGMHPKKVPRAPFSKTFDTGTALFIPNQAEIHVLKYLTGISKAILKNKGQIFANTHVSHIEENDRCKITTSSGNTITSKSLIVATCTPINDRFYIHTKQAAYQTYVIGAQIPKGYVPKGLYWDTPDPYHYIRIQKHETNPNVDWLLVGGEDHRTGQYKAVSHKYTILEKWARARFPDMGEIEFRWSGEIFEPVDSLGFIGKNPHSKNVYISTGDSGNGLTHGTIAGLLLPDLILNKSNPWKDLYDPSRKTLKALPEYAEENANTLYQYRDWLTEGDAKKIDALEKDEGLILRDGLKKLAVYRDRENKLHINSACCPHLGGCVRWNNSEKTWDCPCHGSRFDAYGKVCNGPAKNDLSICSLENQPKQKGE